MPIRVTLTDDHNLVREGLISLLEKHDDIEVTASFNNCLQTLDRISTTKPDVAIVDIGLPEINGIECLRRIRRQAPSVKVLVLSMYASKPIVLSSLSAGASGYLLKDCAAQELARAVRCVAAGQTYVCPSVAGFVTEEIRAREPEDTPFALLTEREREVLQLYAEGFSTNQIAGRLNLSSKTVHTHRQNLTRKLDLKTLPELTKYAIREGLTEPEL